MQNSPPFFWLLLLVVGVLGLASAISGFRLRPSVPSPAITCVSLLPALVMLGLYYSLAVHMYQSLGGWPASIGGRGFPPPLLSHARMATGYFGILLLICLIAWPIAVLLCVVVERWRGSVFYLGTFALACGVSFGVMLLGPSPFLNWWWD